MNAQTKIEAATAPAVYMAISNVMEHMSKEGIGKDRRNSQQGYNFRGIDDVYNTLCGVLASNRLMMLPFVQSMQREERQTQKGGVLNYTILTVDFKLVSALDGSFDIVRMVGEAMDSADKSSNKAQSAAMKYAALQVFMIPTEGDNDPDATTHAVASRSAAPQAGDKSPAKDVPPGMPDHAWAKLVQLVEATKTNTTAMTKHFKVADLRMLSPAQYDEAVAKLEDDLAAQAKASTNNTAQAASMELEPDEIPY